MGTKLLRLVFAVLFFACQSKADTIWTSGHHEINDGDPFYTEIWMYNDSTADMLGGNVGQVGTLDSSVFNMYDGTIGSLMVRGNSVVNIHSGEINSLGIRTSGYYKYNEDDNTYEYIYDNGLVNLYAYDVAYHASDGSGWIEGKYIADDQYFVFEGISPSIYASHINVVPEPATFILLALGGFLLKKNK